MDPLIPYKFLMLEWKEAVPLWFYPLVDSVYLMVFQQQLYAYIYKYIYIQQESEAAKQSL